MDVKILERVRQAIRIRRMRRGFGCSNAQSLFRSITGSRTGSPMADVNDALASNRDAVLELVAAAERSAPTWTTPRAPGKWSPSQIVEHVTRGFEEAAKAVSGVPSSIPMPPAFLRPLLRVLFFNRILKKG